MKELILVSGYYGFGNLGDEAILETLLNHLDGTGMLSRTVVLSNNPEDTRSTFGVEAVDRFNLLGFYDLLQRARLFVSGGGGLFQDSTSFRSVVYYSLLHHLARLAGVEIFVFAQGIGPLNSTLSTFLTRRALSISSALTVRDVKSQALLRSWDMDAELTADPVWALECTGLPAALKSELEEARSEGEILVGVSLREWSGLNQGHLKDFGDSLLRSLPENVRLVPLCLQKEQDSESLSVIVSTWKAAGRQVFDPERSDLSRLCRPSQWLSLIGSLDFVVGMRLHALIMSISMGVPVFGLSYDPKVENVMKEFDQPFLNLVNNSIDDLQFCRAGDLVNEALARRQESSEALHTPLEQIRSYACKNFLFLDRILGR